MPTRHEEIAEILTEEILRGQYRTGERLPSERDLAARFDANRGAVREAIKKLEQLRLADVQPGGARVLAIEESSIDVLGHLLALDDVPNPELVEQMMEVVGSLMKVAAERAVVRASEDEIAHARALIRRLRNPEIELDALVDTRLELVRHFMAMSGNLVLMLISRSLRVSVMGRAERAQKIMHREIQEHDTYLKQMDRALESRDAKATVATLQAMMDLSNASVLTALRSARESGDSRGNGQRRAAQ